MSELLNENEVAEEVCVGNFECAKCKNVFQDCYFSECGHDFCGDCQLLTEKIGPPPCPKCGSLITSLQKNKSAEGDQSFIEEFGQKIFSEEALKPLIDLSHEVSHESDVTGKKEEKNIEENIENLTLSELKEEVSKETGMSEVDNDLLGNKATEIAVLQESPIERSQVIVSLPTAYSPTTDEEIDDLVPLPSNISGLGDFWITTALPDKTIRYQNILRSRGYVLSSASSSSCAGYSRALVPSINARKFRGIPGKDYNILLLGQTGVGKSTFINAFCNYLKFSSLEEAKNGEPEALIACQFTLHDENYKTRTVHFGNDDNEHMQGGQSSTQTCKAYEFPVDNFILRIIDTPGIGDTRGVQQDKSNLNGMLEFISNYEELYAICILLKPNESRLTPFFAFCIKQLLCHLHEKASNNIMFVFTNSRSTFYRPGDTVTPLTEILNQIGSMPPYPKIPFGKENIFCLDNESFRFLIALQNNVKFNQSDFENFGQSWIRSVEESNRMIKLIVEGGNGMGVQPHLVIETLMVNQVRNAIINLSQPLSEIAKNIQVNLQVLNERKEEINACNNDQNKLKKILYLPQVSLSIQELAEPCTVCTGDKCRLLYKVGNLISYHYPQKCHKPCYLKEIPEEIVGVETLKYCWAMGQTKTSCRVCGCHYLKHLHIYYESEEIETQVVDSNVENQLKTKKGAIKAANEMIEKLEEEIDKFKTDELTLSRYVAKLAIYLKQNAMVVCNDSFKDHLSELIENEKAQSFRGSNNYGIIQGLQQMLINYEIEKDILDSAMSNSASNNRISLEEVFDIIEKIKKMEKIGITFTKALTCQTNRLSDSVKNFFQRAARMLKFS